MARARQALPTHNGSNKEESARRGSGDNHSPRHAGVQGMPRMEVNGNGLMMSGGGRESKERGCQLYVRGWVAANGGADKQTREASSA